VNPWIVGRLLQLPKWKSQTEGLKWNGTEILFRVRYLRSFLHRYDFSPVKPSNIRPKDLQMVGHDMCNWSGMMREEILKRPAPEEELPGFYWEGDSLGRFSKKRRFNADQVPCPFVLTGGTQVWATKKERKAIS